MIPATAGSNEAFGCNWHGLKYQAGGYRCKESEVMPSICAEAGGSWQQINC